MSQPTPLTANSFESAVVTMIALRDLEYNSLVQVLEELVDAATESGVDLNPYLTVKQETEH